MEAAKKGGDEGGDECVGGGELPGLRRLDTGEGCPGGSTRFGEDVVTTRGKASQIEATPVTKIVIEGKDNFTHDAGTFPLHIAAVAGLEGGGLGRQASPGGSGAHDPKDGIEDGAIVLPGATGTRGVLREEGLDQAPLVVGEVHGFSR